uniref:Uncharacterized protein n=1 Tax=Strongyloides stercoralis TaxID=6248 RepID=A0A0K0E6U9_STRER
MYLLKVIFLIITFKYTFLTTNGVRQKCIRYKFDKTCFLYIDIIKDNFFANALTIIPTFHLLTLIKMHQKNCLISNSIISMNKYLLGKVNQTAMNQLCLKYRVKYYYPTFLRLYASYPMTRYELNLCKYVESRFLSFF